MAKMYDKIIDILLKTTCIFGITIIIYVVYDIICRVI